MNCEWEKVKIKDCIIAVIDNRGKTPSVQSRGKILLEVNAIKDEKKTPDYSVVRKHVSEEVYNTWFRSGHPQIGDIIIPTVGTLGAVSYLDRNDCCIAQNVIAIRGNQSKIDLDFLYYVLKWDDTKKRLLNLNIGGVQPSIKVPHLLDLEIMLPDLAIQKKIAQILSALDDKIELNNRINKILEEQVITIYVEMFEKNENSLRNVCRADEYFDISIGKTPPRKETQWFSQNLNDVNWVSISDMGSCGLYIISSSEKLTSDAVKRHNIIVVPDNTVLLSFKLTVGRVAITDGEMTTNEAISHFVTDNEEITEYLYCYLRRFNYQAMGSTSSIATAVNSKIIKAMPFVVPTCEELFKFHKIAHPAFNQIKANLRENVVLSNIRDNLLPKLMSGKINVDKLEI